MAHFFKKISIEKLANRLFWLIAATFSRKSPFLRHVVLRRRRFVDDKRRRTSRQLVLRHPHQLGGLGRVRPQYRLDDLLVKVFKFGLKEWRKICPKCAETQRPIIYFYSATNGKRTFDERKTKIGNGQLKTDFSNWKYRFILKTSESSYAT